MLTNTIETIRLAQIRVEQAKENLNESRDNLRKAEDTLTSTYLSLVTNETMDELCSSMDESVQQNVIDVARNALGELSSTQITIKPIVHFSLVVGMTSETAELLNEVFKDSSVANGIMEYLEEHLKSIFNSLDTKGLRYSTTGNAHIDVEHAYLSIPLMFAYKE